MSFLWHADREELSTHDHLIHSLDSPDQDSPPDLDSYSHQLLLHHSSTHSTSEGSLHSTRTHSAWLPVIFIHWNSQKDHFQASEINEMITQFGNYIPFPQRLECLREASRESENPTHWHKWIKVLFNEQEILLHHYFLFLFVSGIPDFIEIFSYPATLICKPFSIKGPNAMNIFG